MKLLLDTHALLWWFADDARLGAEARNAIAEATNDVLVSIVSLWEIVVKVRVGKLEADIAEVAEAIRGNGFSLLPIDRQHLVILRDLPVLHRDPFDHLLIAQALSEKALFVSQDESVRSYDVPCLGCSA